MNRGHDQTWQFSKMPGKDHTTHSTLLTKIIPIHAQNIIYLLSTDTSSILMTTNTSSKEASRAGDGSAEKSAAALTEVPHPNQAAHKHLQLHLYETQRLWSPQVPPFTCTDPHKETNTHIHYQN